MAPVFLSAPSVSRLLLAQTVHELAGVGEWRVVGAVAGGAVCTRRRIAIERPETRCRQAVGSHETVNGVDVVQAGDFVLGVGLSRILGQTNMVERDAGLL